MVTAKRFSHGWLLKAFVGLVVNLSFTTSSVAFELKPSELRGKSSKKKATVLQERFFLKSFRPEVGMLVGSFLNEAYTSTTTTGFRTGMFFSEWFGAEYQMLRTTVKETEDRKALESLKYRDLEEDKVVNPEPETNPIYAVQDFNAVVAPFYGKLNLMDQFIVYSDVYITSGFSKVSTRQGELNAFTMGLGQRFYMMESLSLRLDFRDRMYTETRRERPSRKNALSIDLGLSYFFL